jgi:hypothetical protein
MPLGTLGTTMKNTNTKVDCTTLADQCGLHLPDSAHADLCSQAHADFLYIVKRTQAGSCMGKRGGAARVGVKGLGGAWEGLGAGRGGVGLREVCKQLFYFCLRCMRCMRLPALPALHACFRYTGCFYCVFAVVALVQFMAILENFSQPIHSS